MTREVTVQSHAAPVANLLAIALGAAAISRSVRSLRPRLRSALRGRRYGSLPITGADGAQDHQQGSAGTYGGGAMQSTGWLKTLDKLAAEGRDCHGRDSVPKPLLIDEGSIQPLAIFDQHRAAHGRRVSGTIVRVHTKDILYKGYRHHASTDDPQYEIKSDKTEHVAFHKGRVLRRL